jgi:inosine/xanthosine triphosphatase
MPSVIVAVGSTRPLKLRAVSGALESVGPMLDGTAHYEVVGVEAPSGVRHTPLSRAELMAGAKARATVLMAAAARQGQSWHYFVGLEGGVDVVHEDSHRLAFLESWAFVADAAGRQSWGHAGGVVLPEALAAQVIDQGVELSAAIDEFAGERGIRDAQGAWGALTRDLITRYDVLRAAVINAFAPLFNAALYSR